MNRIGLALSGGGFRATLYHLGLTRFLRDANLLSQVTHITSVSGGSIFAAHLVLNWERYNGSPNEFDAAASEIISLVRLDVRNRITRRFPLTVPFRWPLKLLGVPNRKLTRTGLLEHHYEKYLYGDTSLFELPKKPQLHILATNLSEGCLCSFTRDGLLMVRRAPGNTFHIDRIQIGLATVPMGVTASSAFPGFFPPLELTGVEVGASVGEFGRQAYTDGGVFDNLGIRMFRCLERWILAENHLSVDDFFDAPAVWQALQEASESTEETPLRRIAHVLVDAANTVAETPLHRLGEVFVGAELRPDRSRLANGGVSSDFTTAAARSDAGDRQQRIISSLWDVMNDYQFYHEPLFSHLRPTDPAAESLLHAIRLEGRVPSAADQLWLNRHLLEAAFRETTGRHCFRRLSSGLDAVIVSDVGKPIAVTGARRAGGIIRTALRASDILMDRVWQLEQETFRNAPGFVFAPATTVVEPSLDPTAMHPEIQRRMSRIRTDVDRFSLLEISTLVRHGYCVGRQTCRQHPELFGTDLPLNAPWDPVSTNRATTRSGQVPETSGHSPAPTASTRESRTLQASATRHIWSTLFDPRDWASYVYLPILVALLILLPQRAFRYYEKTERTQLLVDWLYQGNTDMEQVQQMLEKPPVIWPPGSGAVAETRANFDGLTNEGFEIVKETRIVDLRLWDPNDPKKSVVQYLRSARVLKKSEENSEFFIRLMATQDVQVRFPPQRLRATLLKTPEMPGPQPGTTISLWGIIYDFSHVPEGHIETVSALDDSPGLNVQRDMGENHLDFEILSDTAQLSMWILMPKDRAYDSWIITRTLREGPAKIEQVTPVQQFLSADSKIIGFQFVSAKVGEKYEISWTYK